MRRCTCSKILIANFLVFAVNILLHIHNTKHSRNKCFTAASPATSSYNWKAPEMAAFVSPLDAKDRDLLDRTFRTFIEAVESANLTYFMIGGTLIGSLRHHGPIPWDDDVDVMLNASDASKAKDVLSSFDPNFRLYATEDKRGITWWKYFPVNGRKVPLLPEYKTPFVDIWFFYENKTHIWNADLDWKRLNTWPKRKVFPLTRRPYGELFLPAPCNGIVAVGSNINISMCQNSNYNHLIEDWVLNLNIFKIPCDRLVNLFPFVTRSSVAKGSSHRVKETLKLGNWTIRKIMVDKFC